MNHIQNIYNAHKITLNPWRLLIYFTIITTIFTWCWFLTDGGTWDFFQQTQNGKYYDALGENLLQGRMDVPCQVITGEALIKDGKCYGYFGPTPSLLRIVLHRLFPHETGYWSQISLLLALMLNLIFAQSLMAALWKPGSPPQWAIVLMLLFTGTGGTALFLTSPAFIPHEAIAWSGCLALGAYVFMIRYLDQGDTLSLVWAWLLGGLALHARINVGYGALFALLLITSRVALLPFFIRVRNNKTIQVGSFYGIPEAKLGRFNRPAAGIVLGMTILLVTTPFLFSIIKFGEPTLVPLKYHESYQNLLRNNRIQGNFIQLANPIFFAYHYFNPVSLRSSSSFPYFQMGPRHWDLDYIPNIKLDRGESLVSLPNTLPSLMLLSLLGVGWIFKRSGVFAPARIPLLGALLAGTAILFVASISHRYTHDFQSFFLIAGTAGMHRLAHWPNILWRRLGLTTVLLLGLAGVYINTGTAFLSPFAKEGVNHRLIHIRKTLDGPLRNLDLMQVANEFWLNGVNILDPNYYAILSYQKPPVGTRLLFAHSGIRRVVKVTGCIEFDCVIVLDAPVDPLRDGIPFPVRVLSDTDIQNHH